MVGINPKTGRVYGNHGTPSDAIEWLLDAANPHDDNSEFLKCWREGSLREWPEYYQWLKDNGR